MSTRKKQPESFADLVENWEGLLRAYDDNADRLTAALVQRQALEAVLGQAQEIKARQLSHIGAKQRASQEIRGVTAAGKEAARRLRNAVKANVGTDNELLAQFKIAPRRPRSRKTQPEPPQPPAPPPPTVEAQPPPVETSLEDPSKPPAE